MIITNTGLPQATKATSVHEGRVNVFQGLNDPEKELEFLARSKFPTVGNPDHLYIALDENALYIFDSSSRSYIRVASTGASAGCDLDKVETINSTLKENANGNS